MQLQRGDLLYFHETLQLLIARALPLFRHVFPRSLCTFAEPGSKEEQNHCLKEVVKVDLLDSRWDTSIVRTTKVSDLETNFLSFHRLKDSEVPEPRASLIQTLQGALVARNKTWLTSIRSQHKTLNDRQVE